MQSLENEFTRVMSNLKEKVHAQEELQNLMNDEIIYLLQAQRRWKEDRAKMSSVNTINTIIQENDQRILRLQSKVEKKFLLIAQLQL